MVTDDVNILAGRFAWLIDWIFQFAFSRGEAARAALICNRVRRLGKRFAAIIARLQAGTLRPPGWSAGRTRASARDRAHRPAEEPRGFGWMSRLLPLLGGAAGSLCELIYRPQMAELYAEAPQMGRVLRPLCHMLGVQPLPEWLKLPRRVRKVRPTRERAAKPPHPPASGPIFAGKNGSPSRAPPSPQSGEVTMWVANAPTVTSLFLPLGLSTVHAIPDGFPDGIFKIRE